MYEKSNLETYYHMQNRQPMGICCMSQGTEAGAPYQPRGIGWEGDGREVQKGRDICIPMVDSC